MRYLLEISYKGTAYHGWQAQDGDLPTIQGCLNRALQQFLNHPIESVCSGRTDAGVHCRQQFIHFDSDKEIIHKTERFLYSINRMLPPDIKVHGIRLIHTQASARFQAKSRYYQYHIYQQKNPFLVGYSYFYPQSLDLEQMNRAAEKLLRYTDFESFSLVHTEAKHFRCDVHSAYWERLDDSRLVFHVKANRFLRGMVRALVGTLIDVGRGACSPERFEQIILAKDRRAAGRAVPPDGLYLVAVEYPDDIFLNT